MEHTIHTTYVGKVTQQQKKRIKETKIVSKRSCFGACLGSCEVLQMVRWLSQLDNDLHPNQQRHSYRG